MIIIWYFFKKIWNIIKFFLFLWISEIVSCVKIKCLNALFELLIFYAIMNHINHKCIKITQNVWICKLNKLFVMILKYFKYFVILFNCFGIILLALSINCPQIIMHFYSLFNEFVFAFLISLILNIKSIFQLFCKIQCFLKIFDL